MAIIHYIHKCRGRLCIIWYDILHFFNSLQGDQEIFVWMIYVQTLHVLYILKNLNKCCLNHCLLEIFCFFDYFGKLTEFFLDSKQYCTPMKILYLHKKNKKKYHWFWTSTKDEYLEIRFNYWNQVDDEIKWGLCERFLSFHSSFLLIHYPFTLVLDNQKEISLPIISL